MNCRRVASCALLGTLLVTAAPAADAQDVGPAAQARFDEGVKAYDRGDFEAARLAFLETRKLTTRVSVLRNLAQSELKTGHPLDALNHFRDYVADPSVARDKRDRAVKAMADAYHQTGHLVVTTEPTARVLVDGEAATAVDGAVDVTAGAHQVEARAGERHAVRNVEAAAGVVTKVELPLPAVAVDAPAVASGAVVMTAPPAATPSEHADSGSGMAKYVVVGSLGAIAIGSFVASGVLASAASSAHDDGAALGRSLACGASVSECAPFTSKRDSASADYTASALTLGVGVGAVVAAGATWLLWPRASARDAGNTTSWVLPMVGPTGASLQAGFHFE